MLQSVMLTRCVLLHYAIGPLCLHTHVDFREQIPDHGSPTTWVAAGCMLRPFLVCRVKRYVPHRVAPGHLAGQTRPLVASLLRMPSVRLASVASSSRPSSRGSSRHGESAALLIARLSAAIATTVAGGMMAATTTMMMVTTVPTWSHQTLPLAPPLLVAWAHVPRHMMMRAHPMRCAHARRSTHEFMTAAP
jgi:hypothetical protein